MFHFQISLLNDDDECYDFRRERLISHRTHPYYLAINIPQTISDDDITFVAHLSMDRLQVGLVNVTSCTNRVG